MNDIQHKKFSEIADEIADALVKNLNMGVMMDHLDFVEEGIRSLDNGFYTALRLRADIYPNGKFLRLTPKIERAICTAGLLHRNQYRKGAEVKIFYISHPLSVAEILAKHTDDENILCAGILHDTLEDTEYTKQNMIDDFGEADYDEEVFNIVNAVTEQDKRLPWAVRKQQALEHIPLMGKDSRLVKSADVLHNLRAQLSDYEKEGDAIFARFNAPKEAQLERYIKLVGALMASPEDNPLITDLDAAVIRAIQLWSDEN